MKTKNFYNYGARCSITVIDFRLSIIEITQDENILRYFSSFVFRLSYEG